MINNIDNINILKKETLNQQFEKLEIEKKKLYKDRYDFLLVLLNDIFKNNHKALSDFKNIDLSMLILDDYKITIISPKLNEINKLFLINFNIEKNKQNRLYFKYILSKLVKLSGYTLCKKNNKYSII